ncbi:cell division protein FtsZ [Shewanella algae]|uniref:cell division protein FtsZ n=1 Tax=Shewanella algae TaxID=38313 RepID=UPI001AAF6924|nr:cell division FtsZ family protein [Shewanella algae]MBO2589797.1 cell division FtsZ family protein [Shewanella algae]
MFHIMDEPLEKLSAIVVGVGSVGCKIVNDMGEEVIPPEVNKLYIHSSKEALNSYSNEHSESILLNEHIHFLECGIKDRISNIDVIFLVAGLGGETGSLVSQHVARIAKKLGVLCVGLFSFPFTFEGRSKKLRSQQAYLSLSKHIDALVCIENDRFLEFNLKNNSLNDINELFYDSNNHFSALIKGLVNLVLRPGLINVDFNDVKTIFTNMGLSTVGYSLQRGEERAELAVMNLLESPALQHYELSSAKGVLINITAGMDMSIEEFEIVGNTAKQFFAENATVVVGAVIDPDMTDTMGVTAIITGLPELPIDKTIQDNNFDFIKLSKSITFTPHQASAGLSILSYFNEFLHQKYSGIEAKVSIEQTENKVCLIVETASGDVEKIEKSLYEFGLVVVGKKVPSEVLKSNLDVERLQMKLDMAVMELKHNERLLTLYQSENNSYKNRVISLEEQMYELQRVIGSSLTQSQEHLSLQLSNQDELPRNLIHLLEINLKENIPDEARQRIEDDVRKYVTDNSKAMSLKTLAENAFYGVAGNSLYSLVISILSTLPK